MGCTVEIKDRQASSQILSKLSMQSTPAAGRVGNPANKTQNPASTIDLEKNTNRSVVRLTSCWTAGRPGRLDSDFPEETPIGKEFRGKAGQEDVYELLRQKGIWTRWLELVSSPA